MSQSNSLWEKVPLGDKAPDVINVIIEIPKGSHNKYEFDEAFGVFKLDRVLYPSYHYPLDYGFIPETRSEDGDHGDVLVIGSDPAVTGSVVRVRPIAMLHMIDSGDPDAKILGVQADNPRFDTIKDLKDIQAYNPHLLKEVANFFATYKQLQGKKVEIGEWADAKAAKEEIKKSAETYKKEQK
ncbi:MAG TPA: inorganic diphosphatase [Candidatus Paceibacterota bacterium]|jgi:inorganic pyrophosphatase|nr:inorganic diphosphatase [Candidatus Paceibacterota bacterium]